jgi:uncharacterized membrane protein (DUF106 family)
MPFYTEITILVIALLYLGLSLTMQRKLVNTKHVRELRLKMNEINKELREMMKNKAPQETIMAKNKEMMPIAAEQMRSSLKPMLIIPIFLLLYYYILPLEFGGATVAINGITYQTPYVLAVNRSATYTYSFGSSAGHYSLSKVVNGCTGGSNVTSGSISGNSIAGNCTVEGLYDASGATFSTDISDNYASGGVELNVSYNSNNYSYGNSELPVVFAPTGKALHYAYAQNVSAGGVIYKLSSVSACGSNTTSNSGSVNASQVSSGCIVVARYESEGRTAAGQQGASYVTFTGNIGGATGLADLIFQLNYQGLFFYTILILGLITSAVVLIYDSRKMKEMQREKEAGLKSQP